MRSERPLAIRLRKSGQSYNQISRSLGVPKSTLATWFRGLWLPQHVVDALYDRVRSAGTKALVARNKRQTVVAEERARAIQQAARSEIGLLSPRELQLVGASLYWAEGVRRHPVRGGRRVAFSNADPSAIKLMMRFFREICWVPQEKFRAQLTVAPGIEVAPAVRFWSGITGIPEAQFSKVFTGLSRSSQRKRPHARLPYGTLQVRVADTRLFYRIVGWIQAMQDGDGRVSDARPT